MILSIWYANLARFSILFSDFLQWRNSNRSKGYGDNFIWLLEENYKYLEKYPGKIVFLELNKVKYKLTYKEIMISTMAIKSTPDCCLKDITFEEIIEDTKHWSEI